MKKGLTYFLAIFLAVFFFVSCCHAQQIQILAPENGKIVSPGQKIVVSIDADPFAGGITLFTSSDLIDIHPGDREGFFVLEFLPDIPAGEYLVTVEAENGETSSINLNVEGLGKPASLKIDPAEVKFDEIGKKLSVKIFGLFRNGAKTDLTRSFNTTYSSANPKIAAVTSKGNISATGKGKTIITVSHASLSASLPVQVLIDGEDTHVSSPSSSPVTPNTNKGKSDRQWSEQPKNICRILGAGLGFEGCPYPVWRNNTFDSYDLNTGYSFKALNDSGFWGARLDPGIARTPIHAFNKCYYVDNNSRQAFFIPFKTDMEWTAFLKALPAGVTVRPCTVHAVYTSRSATSRGDHAVFSLPAYAVGGDIQTFNQSFGYHVPQRCDETKKCAGPWEWRESISARFKAVPPLWQVIDESVIGEPPVIPGGDH